MQLRIISSQFIRREMSEVLHLLGSYLKPVLIHLNAALLHLSSNLVKFVLCSSGESICHPHLDSPQTIVYLLLEDVLRVL